MKNLHARFALLLSVISMCIGGNSLLAGTGTPTLQNVTIATSGNKVAMWHVVEVSGTSDIQVSNFNALTSVWTVPISVSLTTSTTVYSPKMISDNAGNTAVVWYFLDSVNGIYSLAASMYSATTTLWSVPVVLTPTNQSVGGNFDLEISSAGEVGLIWNAYRTDTSGVEVWTNKATIGDNTSWGTSTQLY